MALDTAFWKDLASRVEIPDEAEFVRRVAAIWVDEWADAVEERRLAPASPASLFFQLGSRMGLERFDEELVQREVARLGLEAEWAAGVPQLDSEQARTVVTFFSPDVWLQDLATVERAQAYGDLSIHGPLELYLALDLAYCVAGALFEQGHRTEADELLDVLGPVTDRYGLLLDVFMPVGLFGLGTAHLLRPQVPAGLGPTLDVLEGLIWEFLDAVESLGDEVLEWRPSVWLEPASEPIRVPPSPELLEAPMPALVDVLAAVEPKWLEGHVPGVLPVAAAADSGPTATTRVRFRGPSGWTAYLSVPPRKHQGPQSQVLAVVVSDRPVASVKLAGIPMKPLGATSHELRMEDLRGKWRRDAPLLEVVFQDGSAEAGWPEED